MLPTSVSSALALALLALAPCSVLAKERYLLFCVNERVPGQPVPTAGPKLRMRGPAALAAPLPLLVNSGQTNAAKPPAQADAVKPPAPTGTVEPYTGPETAWKDGVEMNDEATIAACNAYKSNGCNDCTHGPVTVLGKKYQHTICFSMGAKLRGNKFTKLCKDHYANRGHTAPFGV